MARSPIDRVFDAVVPKAVDAVDPDELIARVDVDALVQRLDVDAVVDRVDVQALIDKVDVQALIERVDVGALIERVDVQALIDRVDVGALIERVDVQGLIDRVDIAALVERVDVQGLIDRVDIAALVDRVDIAALIERVDIDALVARVDIDALVARLDLDALVARLDVDALVARIDVDALLARVDVAALASRAGIDQIVADATTGLATRVLYVVRRKVLVVDQVVLHLVDRLLRRPVDAALDLPPLDGTHPAGPLTRTLGFLVDSVVVSVLFSLGVSLGGTLLELFTGRDFDTADSGGPWWAVAFVAWWFTYLWLGIGVVGRTVGKGLAGLRVLAADGSATGLRRAAVRAAVFPFSFILGLGFVPAVVGRRRRALHDLAAGTAEVIDWGGVALPAVGAAPEPDPTVVVTVAAGQQVEAPAA